MSSRPESRGAAGRSTRPTCEIAAVTSSPWCQQSKESAGGAHRASRHVHGSPGEATSLSSCLRHISPLTSSPGRRCGGSSLSDRSCWGLALLLKRSLKKRWLPANRSLQHRTKLSPASWDPGFGGGRATPRLASILPFLRISICKRPKYFSSALCFYSSVGLFVTEEIKLLFLFLFFCFIKENMRCYRAVGADLCCRQCPVRYCWS